MIRSNDLDTPERGMQLSARPGKLASKDKGNGTPPPETAAEELQVLHERIQAAKHLTPTAGERYRLHCVDCFLRGRDAAIRLIEGA